MSRGRTQDDKSAEVSCWPWSGSVTLASFPCLLSPAVISYRPWGQARWRVVDVTYGLSPRGRHVNTRGLARCRDVRGRRQFHGHVVTWSQAVSWDPQKFLSRASATRTLELLRKHIFKTGLWSSFEGLSPGVCERERGWSVKKESRTGTKLFPSSEGPSTQQQSLATVRKIEWVIVTRSSFLV